MTLRLNHSGSGRPAETQTRGGRRVSSDAGIANEESGSEAISKIDGRRGAPSDCKWLQHSASKAGAAVTGGRRHLGHYIHDISVSTISCAGLSFGRRLSLPLRHHRESGTLGCEDRATSKQSIPYPLHRKVILPVRCFIIESRWTSDRGTGLFSRHKPAVDFREQVGEAS